jgi:hypothetical protein
MGIGEVLFHHYLIHGTLPTSWEELQSGTDRDLSRKRRAVDIDFGKLKSDLPAWLEQNRDRTSHVFRSRSVPVIVRYKRSFWIEEPSAFAEESLNSSWIPELAAYWRESPAAN